MADRYWVGGTDTWDSFAVNRWSTTSGGPGGASAPTINDDVFFTNLSTGTCTIATGRTAKSINCTGFTGTLAGGLSNYTVAGSITLSAGMTYSHTGIAVMTGTGTLTTAGKTFCGVRVDGVGITVTLGDALNVGTSSITLNQGTFNTSGFALTASRIESTVTTTRAINLGSSTVTLSDATPINISSTTGLTFTRGTSLINCTSTATAMTFVSPGLTFYDVSFTGVPTASGGSRIIYGINTFRNLTFTPVTTPSLGAITISFDANQTIQGTFSGSGAAENRRLYYRSTAIGTTRTLTLTSPQTISNADFRDITAATSAITATSGGGNGGGNTNITFPAAKTVYWNLAGSQDWSATGWAATSGGSPAAANFPLAQDTAIFNNTGLAGTVSMGGSWNMGTVDMSARTSAMNFTQNSGIAIYGSWSFGTGVTVTSSTGSYSFVGRGNTQIISCAGKSFGAGANVLIYNIGGTVRLADAFTTSVGANAFLQHGSGTLDLVSFTATCGKFFVDGAGPSSRTIAFGTGNITATTGNSGGDVITLSSTNFTRTGTPTINMSAPGSPAKTIVLGTGWTASNVCSINITSGTYGISFLDTANNAVLDVNFTGFAGTWTATSTAFIYGNLTLSSGMTLTSSNSAMTFASTSTGKTITSSGKTMNFPVTFNGVGGGWTLQDAMTLSSTRTTTLTNGTLNLSTFTLTTGFFDSSSTNTRTIAFGTGNITITNGTGFIWNTNATGLTTTGTQVVNISTASGSSTTITPGSLSEANSISFNITTGSYPLSISAGSAIRALNFTGYSGTMTSSGGFTVYGDLTLSTGMTVGTSASALTFASTSGTPRTITSNARTINMPIVFNGVGGSWVLQDALTVGNIAGLSATLTAGTLNLSTFTLTTPAFSSSNSNTRTIAFGTGNITLNGTGTVWTTATTTGLTTTGTQVVNVSNNSATATTVSSGSLNEANSISFNFTTGTYSLTHTAGTKRNLSFTGFAGTVSNTAQTIYGNLTLVAAATYTSGTNAWTFAATSTGKTITSNTKTMNFPVTFNGVGGSWILQDNMDLGSSRILTHTNGTIDLNNFNLDVGVSYTTATGTKNLTFNGGALVCSGVTATAFNNAVPAGFTTTAGTGTGVIRMTGATAKTFVGGGSTFNCTLSQRGLGALTITGNNTFNNITNTVQPASVLFTAGTTNTFNDFNLNGTPGNLITLDSATAATHTLSKASGTVSVNYLSITNSTATGGATWNAGANSTNGGGNTGWIFSGAGINTGAFFSIL
jgi:hypothetical protein